MDMNKGSGVLVRTRDLRRPFFSEEVANPRGSFTILAWIASVPEIQKELDQFLVVSKKLMSEAAFAALQPILEECTHIWRLDSAWLNTHVFIACLRVISRKIERWRDRYNFVLVMDCASIHTTKDVLTAARILRLPLVFFPRHTTWLLQPLDTHVFRSLKSKIRLLHRADVLARRCFRMNLNDTVRHSILAVQQVVKTQNWARAFSHNGVTNHQRLISARLKKILLVQEPQHVPNVRPPDADVLAILPRNRQKTPLDLLFNSLPPRPAPGPLPARDQDQAARASRSRSRNRDPPNRLDNVPGPRDHPEHVLPHPSTPSLHRDEEVAIPDPNHPWKHRLRQRNDQNAAICSSDLRRSRSRSQVREPASSSSDTWHRPTL